MWGNFSAPVVGTTTNSRLVRWAPPSKIRSSTPSSSRKCCAMSATTSGLAVAVRHSTGGIGSGRAFSRMKRPHVAIVGSEVVPPPGEAVGLVQHPGADLALIQHLPEGAVAELLRRDEHQACITEPDAVQRSSPFGQGQQPVDGYARADPARLQSRHLIRHERDQGRDHHRQGAGLVMTGQRRNLVAERLAGPGRQDPEDMFPGHRRLDDRLLHRAAIGAGRLRAEVGEPEPAGKFLGGVVSFPAPAADWIGAGGVPQLANEPPRHRELVAYPGRHDRVSPGDRQPRQDIGQRPAETSRVRHDLADAGQAGVALQPTLYRLARFGVGRAR